MSEPVPPPVPISPPIAAAPVAAVAPGAPAPVGPFLAKEKILTPQQAADVNKRLPKGVRYEPVLVEPPQPESVIVTGKRIRKPIHYSDDDENKNARRRRSPGDHSDSYLSPLDGEDFRPQRRGSKTPGRGGRSGGGRNSQSRSSTGGRRTSYATAAPVAPPPVVDPLSGLSEAERKLIERHRLEEQLRQIQARLSEVDGGITTSLASPLVSAPTSLMSPYPAPPYTPQLPMQQSLVSPQPTPVAAPVYYTPQPQSQPQPLAPPVTTPAAGAPVAYSQPRKRQHTPRSSSAKKHKGRRDSGSDSDSFSDTPAPRRPARATTRLNLPPPLQQCFKILTQLIAHKWAYPFTSPVDPVAMNLPDYWTIITEPMDLGTIKTKLENGEYETPLQFASDVRLVWKNAMIYNRPEHDVHIMAKELSNVFERKWNQAPFNSVVYSGAVLEGESPTGVRPRAPPKPKAEGSAVDALRQKVAKLEKEKSTLLAGGRPKSSSAKRSKSGRKKHSDSDSFLSSDNDADSDSNSRLLKPMTFEEKRQLSLDINRLPADKVNGMITIISESMPQNDSEEIEIDIDALDTKTLRQLENYVRSCLYQRTPAVGQKRRHGSLAAGGGATSGVSAAQRIEEIEKRLSELQGSINSATEGGDEHVVVDDTPMNEAAPAPQETGASVATPAAAAAATTASSEAAADEDEEEYESSDSEVAPVIAPPAPFASAGVAPQPTTPAAATTPNVSAWNTLAADAAPETPAASSEVTDGGRAEASHHDNATGGSNNDDLWSSFKGISEQQRLRDKELAEAEEKRRKEKEQREAELKAEAERKRKLQEEEEARQAERQRQREEEERRRIEAERVAARAQYEQVTKTVDDSSELIYAAPPASNSNVMLSMDRLRELRGDHHPEQDEQSQPQPQEVKEADT